MREAFNTVCKEKRIKKYQAGKKVSAEGGLRSRDLMISHDGKTTLACMWYFKKKYDYESCALTMLGHLGSGVCDIFQNLF